MTQSEKKSTRYADAIAKGLGVIAGLIILNLLTGCASFKLSTMYHDPLYGPHEVALEVPSDVKIDTLSYSQLRWKLRTDSRFRWDYVHHFSAFLLFSLLFLLWRLNDPGRKRFILMLVAGITFASMTEFSQLFIPSRNFNRAAIRHGLQSIFSSLG